MWQQVNWYKKIWGQTCPRNSCRGIIELLIPTDDSQRKSHPERTNQPSMQLERTKKHGRMTWECCWVRQQQDWKGSRTIGSSAIRTTEPNLGWAILQASLEHFPKARWRRSPATAKVARRKFKPMNFNEKKNKKNPGTDSQPWLRIKFYERTNSERWTRCRLCWRIQIIGRKA